MINTVTIVGRLTADPEIRYTQTQKAVAKFTVACDRNTKEKETDFIECVAWEYRATYLEKYAHKGDQIAVNGRIQVRPWKDKDGNNRKTVEVVANDVNAFGGRKSDGAATTAAPAEFEELEEVGELPF